MKKEGRILRFGSNLWYLGEGLFGPLMAVFAERMGGDILDISWAFSIYLVVSGGLYILFGYLADQISKERLMIVGFALNAIFTFGYLLVSAPWHLFVVQAGLGAAVAMATPSWNALYAQYGDVGRRGFTWGLAAGEAAIVTGLAMLIGGLIVKNVSFVFLFTLMGFVQTVATVYQARILRK
jgi:MFS family permease